MFHLVGCGLSTAPPYTTGRQHVPHPLLLTTGRVSELTIAKAATQARWRAGTRKQRIEVYLAPETTAALDAQPGTRAQAITALVTGTASTSSQIPHQRAPESEGSTTSVEVTDQQAQSPTDQRAYKFRRPKPGESKCNWLVTTPEGQPWGEIERYKPGLTPGWRGRYLNKSLTWRWCQKKRRDEVAETLLKYPDIYQ